MDYINELKCKNISFNVFTECDAMHIMETEYSYFKLMEYVNLFPVYKKCEMRNWLVGVDFSHLYFLSMIDETFSRIVLSECLDIEQTLKTILTNYINQIGDKEYFVKSFLEFDKEYLLKTYTRENIDIIGEKYSVNDLTCLEFEQIIDVLQFSTLERMLQYFYELYSHKLSLKDFEHYRKHIGYVKKLRNKAAHNHSIIGQLHVKSEVKSDSVAAYLGKHGISNRTLRTNMAKPVVLEFCHLIHLYHLIEPDYKIEENLKQLETFLYDYCDEYIEFFKNNSILTSAYKFVCSVVDVYRNRK